MQVCVAAAGPAPTSARWRAARPLGAKLEAALTRAYSGLKVELKPSAVA